MFAAPCGKGYKMKHIHVIIVPHRCRGCQARDVIHCLCPVKVWPTCLPLPESHTHTCGSVRGRWEREVKGEERKGEERRGEIRRGREGEREKGRERKGERGRGRGKKREKERESSLI